MDKLKGYKTIILNIIVAIFGVLESADWVNTIGSNKAGEVATGLAIANIVLRKLTTTPVGTK